MNEISVSDAMPLIGRITMGGLWQLLEHGSMRKPDIRPVFMQDGFWLRLQQKRDALHHPKQDNPDSEYYRSSQRILGVSLFPVDNILFAFNPSPNINYYCHVRSENHNVEWKDEYSRGKTV